MEYLVTQPAKAGGNPCPAEEAGPNHQKERFFQLSRKSAAAASRHRKGAMLPAAPVCGGAGEGSAGAKASSCPVTIELPVE